MNPSIIERELLDARVVAEGLAFPEGPVALDDGSVLVVEIRAGNLTRVSPDGRLDVVAHTGGGPNGAAIGPDGAAYICNNGGITADRGPGSIQRVDLATGAVATLYTHCNGHPLRAPNDIVFDRAGGFWFTDLGRRDGRAYLPGGIYYARPDGGDVREVVFPVEHANGVGLSPDDATLYWAETRMRRVMRRGVTAPGELAPSNGVEIAAIVRGEILDFDVVLLGMPGVHEFDSLAVDSAGHVVVATLIDSGLTDISPTGDVTLWRLPPSIEDRMVTNVCFGGADLCTAFLTLSQTGRLVACRWPRPGLRLAY